MIQYQLKDLELINDTHDLNLLVSYGVSVLRMFNEFK